MNEYGKFIRSISPDRIKDIFKKNGVFITDNQSFKITDFVYTIAETLIGRDFVDSGELKKKSRSKNRKK